MTKMVFLVDSDVAVRQLSREILEKAGYVVQDYSCTPAVEDVISCQPAGVVVAASLLAVSGAEFCRRIRQTSSLMATRIILLLDHDLAEASMIEADNYIQKPFTAEELVFSVRSSSRVWSGPSHHSAEFSAILIDRASMKVSINGNEVTTTTLEFRVMDYLAQNQRCVCTRDMLLDAAWGDLQFVTPRSVDTCIRRLRNKIEPNRSKPTYLKTIRGVGYRLDANAAWSDSNGSCTCRACSPSIGYDGLARLGTRRRKKRMVPHASAAV
jgi:two-component system, OmpR family, alkaline phosphatase synthesis response regulator PhoP